MPASLPYLASPGSLKTALERIRTAATPERVTQDFVTTKLQIKGGTGAAIPPFLKKIGFVATDGTPTELYKQFRNASTGGQAAAKAVKTGYAPLAEVNEYFYSLSDNELLDLIVQVTGAEKTASSTRQTLSTLKNIKAFADFEGSTLAEEKSPPAPAENIGGKPASLDGRVGLNLSYTINLNLPATSDQSVFNAIFKSLREHLLSNE